MNIRELMQTAMVEQAKRKNEKIIHSSFWLRDLDYYRSLANGDQTTLEFGLALANIRRGIANFVRIVTGRDIPVHYSTGKQSFSRASNEMVVISATTDPDKLDVNVGLALHEAAHLLLSRITPNVKESIPLFDFLAHLATPNAIFFPSSIIPHLTRLGMTEKQGRGLVKMVLNVMEDRRIDNWMYETAEGYRRYYDAMYYHYWMSPTTTARFQSAAAKRPFVDSYMFHIVNMCNPAATEDALPKMDEIWKLVNIDAIDRFSNDPKWATYPASVHKNASGFIVYPRTQLPEMVRTAIDIVRIILENAELPPVPTKKVTVLDMPPVPVTGLGLDEEDEEDEEDDENDQVIMPTDDPNNLDTGNEAGKKTQGPSQPSSDSDSPTKGKSLEEELQDLADDNTRADSLLGGNTTRQAIDRTLADQLETIETTGTTVENVKWGRNQNTVKVIVHHKLTTQLIFSPGFDFTTTVDGGAMVFGRMKDVIGEGMVMGNVLSHRLKIMADETPLTYNRLSSGHLDKRRIAGLGYDETAVFQQTLIDKHTPVFVHLSIDNSASMMGEKFEQSMRLAVALAKAATTSPILDVVISLRSALNAPTVLIAYDSRVDNISKIPAMFKYLQVAGGTPEGLVFAVLKDEIIKYDNKGRKFFVNLSDGAPDCFVPGGGAYKGKPSWTHTAEQVQMMRQAGITVLSYLIETGTMFESNNTREAFKLMYGKSAAFIDVKNVLDIAASLNRMFLET